MSQGHHCSIGRCPLVSLDLGVLVPEFSCCEQGVRRPSSCCWPGVTWRLNFKVFIWEGAGSALVHSSSIQGHVKTVVLLLHLGISGSSRFDQIKSGHIAVFLTNYLQVYMSECAPAWLRASCRVTHVKQSGV